MMKLTNHWGLFVLLSHLAGCSMAPEYDQPVLPTALQYPVLSDKETSMDDKVHTASKTSWQQFYQQPELRTLIQAALDNNRDMRTAILNIEQARLMYNVQRHELLPAIDGTAGYAKQRLSKETVAPGTALLTKEYQIGIGITAFEFDLFGRIESLNDEALAAYLAVEETARAAQISLIAAVAHAYLNERSLSAQLDLAEQAVVASQQAYQMIMQQFDLGQLDQTSLQLQQGRLYQMQIQAAEMKRMQAQAYNTLVMLVGQLDIATPQVSFAKIRPINARFFAGLPSDLLLTRPDVVAAEQQLKAANAHIGAARAAFFPRISLTTLLGTASPKLSHLFKSNTRTWSFSPMLVLPIFDWGTNIDNLDLAEVRKEISVIAYEKTIQTAFKEVADALAAKSAYDHQQPFQQGYVDTVMSQINLIKQKYAHGLVSYLDVLSYLQELYATQQAFIRFQQVQMDNAIDLYKVLGGGLNNVMAAQL